MLILNPLAPTLQDRHLPYESDSLSDETVFVATSEKINAVMNDKTINSFFMFLF